MSGFRIISEKTGVGGQNEYAQIMRDLIEAARLARENAFAPFSGFKVGAAVATKDGRLYTGCNIENASYGLTLCAERVAIFKAVSEGARAFSRIAVVADTDELTPPCGACRQIIWEFCGNCELFLANLKGRSEVIAVADIFPRAFDLSFLQPQKYRDSEDR